jgi:uncharacterized membrane protein
MAKGGGSAALLDDAGRQRVVDAIGAAEARSRGEIRIHMEARCPGGDPVVRGGRVFEELGMTATALRNGVLVYVAVEDRGFAVLGDSGIHDKVGPELWSDVATAMGRRFAAGAFADGLVEAIARIGDALAAHFPRAREAEADVDELPNEISFGGDPTG